jgi:hypothetical protein
MNYRKLVATTAATVLALGGGLFVGSQFAQANDSTPQRVPTPGVYAEDLPAYETLANGKTAGLWRPETPLEDRPDYMPVTLKKGVHGYVARADIPDVYIPWERQTGTHTVGPEEAAAMRDETARLTSRASANGDVYAPVYAKDGTTKIGALLVDTVQAERE